MFTMAELGFPENIPDVQGITYKKLKGMWADSIQSFLNDIAEKDTIPILSGMSKASLMPLARVVRKMTTYRTKLSEARFESFGHVVKGWTDMSGRWHRKGYRSMAHGIKEGESCFIVDYGNINDWSFRFEFKINVYQWFLHEMGDVPDQYHGAWNALPSAIEAFEATMNDRLAQIADEIVPTFFNVTAVTWE